MKYLICNTTTYNHSDYGKPISVHKSTDYRTSTSISHDFVPQFPQEFDARHKINKSIFRLKDPILKDDFYLTDNHRHYIVKKSTKDPLTQTNASFLDKVNYLHSFEEKLFRKPPPPIPPSKTEKKDEYTRKYFNFERRKVFPPDPYRICEMKAFGRDEQPPFRPDAPGYSKHLDIYLTTTRATYIPHSKERQDGIGRKNIITFYDANGQPKGGKGFGPREDINVEPIVKRREPPLPKPKPIRDHLLFPKICLDTYKTETKDEFVLQTYSDLYPYIFDTGEYLPGAVGNATSWQALAPPAMYCSEFCHTGTGWPVNSVIEYKTPKRQYTHKLLEYEQPCYCE